MDKTERSTEEVILGYCSLGCALIILPFIPYRWWEGDYRLALIDTAIVAGIAVIGFFSWRSRNIEVTRTLLNIFSMIAVIASIYSKGIISVNWLYPMSVLSFFLSNIRNAWMINGLGMAVLVPMIFNGTSTDHAIVIMGSLVMSNLVAHIFASITTKHRRTLSEIAVRDDLTGAYNRRAFSQTLKESMELKQRGLDRICAILIDLDHFKLANDSYGHFVGDELLVHLCKIIQGHIRLTDRLFRYGGEEFVLILRGFSLSKALYVAEKLRQAVEEDVFLGKHGVTISLGVAELKDHETQAEWMKRVDAALYESKKQGRNRTSAAEDQIPAKASAL